MGWFRSLIADFARDTYGPDEPGGSGWGVGELPDGESETPRPGERDHRYDPSAERGDPAYRPPENRAEAQARTIYLDQVAPRTDDPPGTAPRWPTDEWWDREAGRLRGPTAEEERAADRAEDPFDPPHPDEFAEDGPEDAPTDFYDPTDPDVLGAEYEQAGVARYGDEDPAPAWRPADDFRVFDPGHPDADDLGSRPMTDGEYRELADAVRAGQPERFGGDPTPPEPRDPQMPDEMQQTVATEDGPARVGWVEAATHQELYDEGDRIEYDYNRNGQTDPRLDAQLDAISDESDARQAAQREQDTADRFDPDRGWGPVVDPAPDSAVNAAWNAPLPDTGPAPVDEDMARIEAAFADPEPDPAAGMEPAGPAPEAGVER